jgi:hypothetical protein
LLTVLVEIAKGPELSTDVVEDAAGAAQTHRNMTASPAGPARVISRFGADPIIAARCIFTWYWIAERFTHPMVKESIEADLPTLDA